MTSKEALQHIINLVCDIPTTGDRLEEELKSIQKDIEVLQILKDRLPLITIIRVMKYEGTYGLYNSINSTNIKKEEYELLKEWLNK